MIEEREFLELVGNSIRKNRLSKKISSEKLAEFSNMDYTSINLIENQKQNPRAYTLYKLLFALDIDITSLLKEKSLQQQEIKDKIIKKLELMSETQLSSLLEFLGSFEVIAKYHS